MRTHVGPQRQRIFLQPQRSSKRGPTTQKMVLHRRHCTERVRTCIEHSYRWDSCMLGSSQGSSRGSAEFDQVHTISSRMAKVAGEYIGQHIASIILYLASDNVDHVSCASECICVAAADPISSGHRSFNAHFQSFRQHRIPNTLAASILHATSTFFHPAVPCAGLAHIRTICS